MNYIVVTLRYQDMETNLGLPTTVPLSVLGPILAKQFSPDQTPSTTRNYTGRVRDSGLVVRPHETLAQAGIVDGHIVELVAHEEILSSPPAIRDSYLKCLETEQVFRCRATHMLVGRLKECHVNLSTLPRKDIVSRQHAQILFHNGIYSIQDWNSANGTIVDGHLLERAEKIRLKNGMQIEFGRGGPRLVFHTDKD